jgi:hypothetical protein
VVPQDPTYANLQNGINYINDTTVVLQLFAPQKEHIYVIGDFNNWTPTTNWIVRPELRYDWYTPSAYGTGALPFGPISARSNGLVTGDAFSQWYIGCDAIYQF